MIKLMRDSAHKYPWLLKSIMGALALAFVITMGWWGFGEQSSNAVASVGDQTISRDEFRRNYENTYRYYKENIKGELKEEEIKQYVIDGLVENKLWTLAAQDLGLRISPEELRDDIMRRGDFQRNGQFDPELYRRLLAANRLTPPLFESLYSVELLSAGRLDALRDCGSASSDGPAATVRPEDRLFGQRSHSAGLFIPKTTAGAGGLYTILESPHPDRNSQGTALARVIRERFCCNRGYAAVTGVLAAQSVNVLP